MDSTSLTSLALMKLRLDEQKGDAYSVFEPLVADMLFTRRPAEITDQRIAEDFLAEYGLQIPTTSMHHVLRRLARKGYLRKEHHVYRPTEHLQPIPWLAEERRNAEDNTRIVIRELINFCKAEFGMTISDDEAVISILLFLDKFSVDCLRAYVFQSSLPKPQDRGVKNEYAVGKFVYWANDKNPGLFERIILLVRCQMCANAVLCPDLQSLDKKFGNVRFYVDAPLLLNLTGLHGSAERRRTVELLELVAALDGKLFAFEHSILEAQTIITSTKPHFYNYDVTTRILRACRDEQMQLTDLELAEEAFVPTLKKHHIKVVPTPEYVEQFQVSEQDLEAFIREKVHRTAERATRVDINSIRSIFVLRHGVVPLRLEDAAHVFVTDNQALARAAWEYSKEHNSFREVSPVIADYSLANIAWLKAPMKSPDLPTIETLALCYAAIRPRQGFEEKMLATVDSLREQGHISAAAHATMRSSRAYEQELMRLTLGDEEDLKPATAMEALEKLKHELTIEHVSEISTLKAEKRSVAEELTDVNAELAVRESHGKKVSGRIAAIIAALLYLTFFALSIYVVILEIARIKDNGVLVVVYSAIGFILNLAAIYGIAFKLRQYLARWFRVSLYGMKVGNKTELEPTEG